MATIFIGIGGSGITTVTKIKKNYNRFEFTRAGAKKSKVIFAGIDVDKPKLSENQSIEFIPVSVPNPKEVIDYHWKEDPYFKKWWHEGFYPETSLSPGNAAGRHRYNGRLIFWQNFTSITKGIRALIAKAENIDPDTTKGDNAHSIYLINSIAGGTGAGMFIDVGFLIRDLLGNHEGIRLYSFLFHGMIWEKAGHIDSNKVALGSLTQLERWMERPDKFKMKYFDNKLPSQTDKFDSLFDIVYIIDEKNLDGKQFIRKGNLSLIELYMEFGSWLLFALSLDDIGGQIQNSLHELRDLPQISSNGERSLRYGSAAVSILTTPYEEISDWLRGAFVSGFENGFGKTNLTDPTKFLKENEIYEEDASQFSKVLRDLKAFGALSGYVKNISSNIGKTKNRAVFDNNITVNHLIELTEVNKNFSSWKKEIDAKILETTSQFSRKLKESLIKEMEATLDFNGISKYLNNLITKLELQQEKISRTYLVEKSSSEISEIMKKIILDIDELPSSPVKFIFKKGEFNNLRDKWLAHSGFNNFDKEKTYTNAKMGEMLKGLLTNFYETLKEIVRTNAELINSVNEIYSKLIKNYEELKVSYHHDKSNILNVEKLKRNDFPLLISVPVDREDLTQVHKELKEDSTIIDSFRNSLWTGMNIENRSLDGLSSFYDKLHDDNEESKGRNKDAIISTAFEHLKEITKYKLSKEIKEKVNKKFRIDKALKSFFRKKYQEYQNSMSFSEEKSRFLTEFAYQVGEEYIGELQNKKLERAEWVNLAIKGFLNKLQKSLNPFWSLNNLSAYQKDTKIKRNKYNPHEEPTIYKSEKLDLSLDDMNTEKLHSDEYRIFILSYMYGCPLHLLNCVRGANYELYNDTEGSLCAFNDERFLNEWKDNIEQESRFEYNDFLFIMALGFNIIERTKKGKATSKSFYYGTKKLGTITNAMSQIQDNYMEQIKEEVKRKFRDEIFTSQASTEDIITKYNTLLAGVDKQLKSIKPPSSSGNETANNIWKHLKDQVNVKRDSKGNIMKYVGSFYRNQREEIGELLKEHTGLVLD